jgi:hypothetical protein
MFHRLFTVGSAVSLLLCVATCVLWVVVGEAKELLALNRLEHPETTAAGAYARITAAVVPYWVAAGVTAVLPLLWVACRHNLHRALHRLCPG